MTVEEAYRHCEEVTRAEAANFYYGIRLLPRERRAAMCAVYAFARRVDDIGDGVLPDEQKLARLDEQVRALAAVELAAAGEPGAAGSEPGPAGPSGADSGGGEPRSRAPAAVLGVAGRDDSVGVALAHTYRRFRPPADALYALIEGVRMDVSGVSYETFDELVLYCRRVAGAIGRVSLAIFATRTGARQLARAEVLADDLGVALQLTNILRDLREDAEGGRVYLPIEDLRRFALVPANEGREGAVAHLAAVLADGRREREALSALVGFEAARAREWFDRGLGLARLLDRRSAACVLAMAGIYSRLLQRIEADPLAALERRTSLPAREKAWVAARAMLGAPA
jgi:phytoene synthase